MRPNLHPVSASAPGSLILMGEHAVLHGHRALCAALDQRIFVHLSPRPDRRVRIESHLGSYEEDLENAHPTPPFHFLLHALRLHPPPRGLTLRIQADFSADIGFGSSAAVTVAALAALHAAIGEPLDRAGIFTDARAVLHAAQGRGSGADLAAATFGGVVLYPARRREIEPFICSLPLSAHYLGYKTPTPDVIRIIDDLWRGREAEREALFREMDALCLQAANDMRSGDMEKLGEHFTAHQSCQTRLGCSDDSTETLLQALHAAPDIHGAKISGAGRGDCVIALGNPHISIPPFRPIRVHLTPEGVRVTPPTPT